MSKGNRETRKPKAEKPKPAAAALPAGLTPMARKTK
jgi:hypothetical protein